MCWHRRFWRTPALSDVGLLKIHILFVSSADLCEGGLPQNVCEQSEKQNLAQVKSQWVWQRFRVVTCHMGVPSKEMQQSVCACFAVGEAWDKYLHCFLFCGIWVFKHEDLFMYLFICVKKLFLKPTTFTVYLSPSLRDRKGGKYGANYYFIVISLRFPPCCRWLEVL